MSKLVEENPKDLAKYGLDKPAMTVTIGAGSAKTVLEVSKAKDGETYAKDASRPIVFMVDTTLQGDLEKNFDDYRKKELFEFRPFYLAKLRAVLDAPGGPKTYEFEKQKPAKPADPETWKVTRVGGSSHTADQTAMDDLLNKLRGDQGRVVRRREDQDRSRQARARRQRQLRRRQVRARAVRPGRRTSPTACATAKPASRRSTCPRSATRSRPSISR